MSNKYGARRTYSELCGRWFASKMEAQRGEELCLLEKAGEISDLEYQKKFILSKGPKVSIAIDFAYVGYGDVPGQLYDEAGDAYGVEIYEDTKGALTRDFRTKLIWLKQLLGIEVLLTRGNR